MCGHTIKSSLIHKLTLDTRDDPVLPTSGAEFTLVQELAGLAPIGTTAFFKTTCSAAIHKRYIFIFQLYHRAQLRNMYEIGTVLIGRMLLC